jgi:hypothetical protein
MRPYLEKPHNKNGLVDWLNMKALSSSLSIAKKKRTTHVKEMLAFILLA